MSNGYITGTYYLSKAGARCTVVRSKIQQRRLQILVHSYIYYECDTNIVDDDTWNRWAQELVQLQREYPSISRSTGYAEAFIRWSGSTGIGLPYKNPEIARKALQLLSYHS